MRLDAQVRLILETESEKKSQLSQEVRLSINPQKRFIFNYKYSCIDKVSYI